MKKIKLLCMSAAVIATLFSSTVFAADAVQPTQTLQVDNAISMAMTNSYTLKKLDIGIQQAKNNYNASLKSAAKYDKMLPYALQKDERLNLIQGIDTPQLEYKYAIFQYTNVKEVAKNQLKLGVYQLYSGLISAKEGLDVEQQNFNNVEDQYKKAQLQLQLGTVSPVDVKTSEAAYNAEMAKMNQIQRQYDSLTKQLNQLLGVDINIKYTAFSTDNLQTTAYPKTYDEYLSDAIKNRVEIKNDTENVKLKNSEFASVRGVYQYNTDPHYKIAEYSVEDAKNKLATAKIDISIEINSLYNDLQLKIKQLEPEQKKYDSAKRTYDKAAQSYNLGLISKIDFDKAAVGLKAEEVAIKSIQRNIWFAQTKLQYASDIGTDASCL
jgi:opacity protein-like surface antigen